jgi:hypothetical protein
MGGSRIEYVKLFRGFIFIGILNNNKATTIINAISCR